VRVDGNFNVRDLGAGFGIEEAEVVADFIDRDQAGVAGGIVGIRQRFWQPRRGVSKEPTG
jgi:hypothetical protein